MEYYNDPSAYQGFCPYACPYMNHCMRPCIYPAYTNNDEYLEDNMRATYKIEISTAARTLKLFRNGSLYKTYPVGIGKPSTPTPKGNFTIINRAVNPGGPFGVRWLGLNKKGYGIHGTNNPASIGKAVSNGCIRMHNKDVLEVANLVPIGTAVTIT